MNWKGLAGGILLIVLIGLAGFLYRSIKEQPTGSIACTADAKVCPDGTGLGRTGPSCTFPACPPPNVDLASAGLAFALPMGYSADQVQSDDPTLIGAYTNGSQKILIRQYTLDASTTAADFIRSNAISDPSEMPAPATAFSSLTIASRRFTVVTLQRFEGTVDTAYYFSRENDVLRFDALSQSVDNWTDPALNVATLPASKDLRSLLGTLQGD